MRQVLLPMLALLGVALMVLGISWKWLHPPESYWSPEQAQAYLDAFTAVHAAQHSGKQGHTAAEFSAARQRYDEMKRDLERARTARDRTSTLLTAGGLVLLLSAVVLRHFRRGSDD